MTDITKTILVILIAAAEVIALQYVKAEKLLVRCLIAALGTLAITSTLNPAILGEISVAMVLLFVIVLFIQMRRDSR